MTFLLALVNHKHLGYILVPYLAQRKERQECYAILEKATLQHQNLSNAQHKLIKITHNYDIQHLYQRYCKNKKRIPLRHFLDETEPEILDKHIRTYIEKQLDKCFKLLKEEPQLLYLKKEREINCYDEKKLEISPKHFTPVFTFKRTKEGIFYKLCIKQKEQNLAIQDHKNAIIANSPCYLKVNNQICHIHNSDGAKFKPFLQRGHIHIKKELEAQYISGFIAKCVKSYPVITEGLTITDQVTKPECTLLLTTDLQQNPVLSLQFHYHKHTFNYGTQSTIEVSYQRQGDDYLLQRIIPNHDDEASTVVLLQNLNLIPRNDTFFRPLNKDNNHASIIEWLALNEKKLKDNNIKISQEGLSAKYFIGYAEVSLDLPEEQYNKFDWFDIEAYVIVGDFKIPFVQFKQHILDKITDFILPDGRLFLIPESWFEEYSGLLLMAKHNDNKLRLAAHHFPLTEGLIQKPQLKNHDISNYKKKELALPKNVDAKLRDYQIEGYKWMHELCQLHMGGILADDMGLGKTLQTITLLSHFYPETPNTPDIIGDHQTLIDKDSSIDNVTCEPSLIIAPTSLVHNWANEFKKFNPRLKIWLHTGYKRGKIAEHYNKAQIIITSYGVIRNEIKDFQSSPFLCTVLDESHTIKNARSKAYRSVMKIDSLYRLALTGTPIENSLNDLWSQFNFINPGMLGNAAFFEKHFKLPIEKQHDKRASINLIRLTAPFILRRTKQEVIKELPPVSEQTIWCEMSDKQSEIYEKEKARARHAILDDSPTKNTGQKRLQILSSLMKLRQIASHPVMTNTSTDADSGKLEEVMNILINLRKEGHKALIFSSFVKHLNIIQERLEGENINYALLTGETAKRQDVVDEFQNNADQSFFLISLKAGGVGLNLTAASYVLILDPWWNPAAEQQAIGRAHRIGQNKHVMVYHFISKNTIEEKVQLLQQRKKQLAGDFTDNNAFNKLSDAELYEIISD